MFGCDYRTIFWFFSAFRVDNSRVVLAILGIGLVLTSNSYHIFLVIGVQKPQLDEPG